MTLRTTTSLQRLDMLLAQAERFAHDGLRGEAIARAKQVIAYAERDAQRGDDGDGLAQRMLLAEALIKRLGKSVRNSQGELQVQAEDAAHPGAWSE